MLMKILVVILVPLCVIGVDPCKNGECKCGAAKSTCFFRQFYNSFPSNIPTNVEVMVIAGSRTKPNAIGRFSRINFQKLSMLSMRHCGIKEVENGAFASVSGLRTLQIAYNNLSVVNKQMFQGLSGLKVLDLSGNKNCQIQNGAFDGISGLFELLLAEINLKTLNIDMIKPLTSLRKLDIHGNGFKTLEWSVFRSFSNLNFLDVSKNELTSIPAEMKPIFDRTQSVFLSDNPWVCDWDLKWLKNLSVSFSVEASWASVVCDSPPDVKYYSLVNVPDSKLAPIIPKILFCDTRQASANEGSSLFINCSTEGKPAPFLSWRNPAGTIFADNTTSGGRIVINNSSLLIQNVLASDKGNWTLSASSRFGEDQRIIEIRVILSTTTTTTTSTTTTSPTTAATTKVTTTPAANQPTKQTASILTRVTTVTKVTNATTDAAPNMMMYYAAGGGGGLLLLIIIIIICCKKSKNSGAVNNDGFDTVRSQRKTVSRAKPTRVDVEPRRRAYD